ncbi:hypothetical protein GCM10011507_34960 [Edaphobacter acidisoli]|uniref:Peptidase S49 domain-containing protein n=1 Tax=Edaphobacter acidisoli TaxID=2040573 RepID=A0A916WAQ7_9BACT|nr:S49 family peptidase [Edaphobacter acidisoli]GGA80750.1 hypothetical protein GCM10011507_34960 [Edaphobacter acidisoli]
MTLYESVRKAMYGQVWAMRPENLKALEALVRVGAARSVLGATEEAILAAALGIQAARSARLASGAKGSVAVIPVYGTVSRFGWGASTLQLAGQLRQAVGDPNVGAIVLDIDSPGGTVEGVDELASEIRAARGQKKIIACTGGMCASAAYYLASACSEIVVAPSALIGSVGVYSIHEDDSQYLDNLGIRVTLISYGENKTNGNPYEPLGDGARQDMQQMVDDFGGMFEAAVAKGRKTSQANVHATYGQGKVFGAKQAVKIGMADTVATLDEVLARYGAVIQGASSPYGLVSGEVLAGEKKTKRVDGEDLEKSAFAYQGSEKTEDWHLPIEFSTDEKTEAHIRDAISRWSETEMPDAEEKKRARARIKAAAKKHGIEVSDDSLASADGASIEAAHARYRRQLELAGA